MGMQGQHNEKISSKALVYDTMIHHVDRLIKRCLGISQHLRDRPVVPGIGQEDSLEKQKDAAEGSVKACRRKWMAPRASTREIPAKIMEVSSKPGQSRSPRFCSTKNWR